MQVDSANCLIQQSGVVAYTNQSLTALGNYNATYSFTNDRSGGLAEGFAYTTSAATSAQVITPYLGHQKVLQIYDNGAGGTDYVYVVNTFAAQTAGTVSFWFCFTPITCQYIRVYLDDGVNNGVDLLFGNSLVQAYNGGWVTILTPIANRWYHFNVTFTAGVTRTFNVDVDGKRVATGYAFQQAATTITRFMLYTDGAGTTNYYGWLDALDYSWTTEYDASKSRNAIDLGQVGIYNATYSFQNETMFGNTPGGFVDGSGAGCYARVYPQVATGAYGHHNILCLDDQNAGTIAQVQYSYPANQIAGTVEYWLLSTNVALTTHCQFYGWNAAHAVNPWNIYIAASVLYAAGTGTVTLLSGLTSNTWYHIRIRFDTVADTFSVWVNGMLKSSNQAATAVTEVAQIYCNTGAFGNTLQLYLDGFDVSSDPYYVTERSTLMLCNTSLQFDRAGDFSYQWQLWSSNVAYNQNPIGFIVQNNLQFVSEDTTHATVWTLSPTSNPLTWTSLYQTNFAAEAWNISTTGATRIQNDWTTPAGDTYIYSASPATNYGVATTLGIGYVIATGATRRTFIEFPYSYAAYNANLSMKLYRNWETTAERTVTVSESSDFDEAVITWNNPPTIGSAYLEPLTITIGPAGYYTWNKPFWNGITHLAFKCDEAAETNLNFYSKESGMSDSYLPKYQIATNKFNQTSAYAIMQTNTTESLTMNSSLFAPLALQANDRITITYQTTCAGSIDMLMLNNSVEMESYPLDSTTTAEQTKVFTLQTGEAYGINQTQFVANLQDGEYFKVTSLKIERAISGNLMAEATLPPAGEFFGDVAPGEYFLIVYDSDGNPLDTRIVTVSQYIRNDFIFTPIYSGERQVTFFTNGIPVDTSNFWVNLTRTYLNITESAILTGNRFLADDGTNAEFEIRDLFSNSIINASELVSNFIDITIPYCYSFKVQNKMRIQTEVSLSRNGVTKSEYIMPDEIVEYLLYNGTYQISYLQSETQETISTTLDITSNGIYLMNSSWYQVYVTAICPNYPMIPRENFRLYVNSTLYDWGFIQCLGSPKNLTVLDWWNNSLYTQVIDLDNYANSEFDIVLNVHNVQIQNLMREDTTFNLTCNNLNYSRVLLAGEYSDLFLFAGIYELNYTQTELNIPLNATLNIVGATRYIINSSYHTCWFSQFGPDLFGLGDEGMRLYVNSTRKNWETPIELLGDWFNVTALDFFGDVQYAGIVNLSNSTEFNIPIIYAWVNLENHYNFTTYCRIEKNNTMLINVMLEGNWSTQFRFTLGTYNITFWDASGNHIQDAYTNDITFTLNANDTQLVAFGFTEFDVPVNFKTDVKDFLLLVVIVAGTIIGFVFLKAAQINAENKKIRRGKSKAGFSDNRVS